MEFSSLILCRVIFLTTIPFITYGARNFVVVMNYFNCSVNPKYASPPTCYINMTSNPRSAFVEIQIHRQLPNLRYSIDATLIKNKNERYPILQVRNSDACKFLEGKIPLVFLRAAREIILMAGKLPKKCPINKDYHFHFQNLVLDAEKIPPFVPQGEYDVKLNITQGKDLVLSFEGRATVAAKSKG